MTYYWICYKEASKYDSSNSKIEEIAVNVHPFLYTLDAYFSFTIINWKEISEEEFNMFRGNKEILPDDYTPDKRKKEVSDRMNCYSFN